VREHSHGKGKVICGRPLRDVLAGRGVGPDFSYQDPAGGADLDFIHRRHGEADIYFVRNKLRRWAEVEAAFRVRGKRPELWNPADCGRRDAPAYEIGPAGVRLPLRLAPEGSVFVVFREPAGGGPVAAVPPATPPETVEVAGPWVVQFPPDSGAPETATFDRLASWTDHADPGIRFFSGVAGYRRQIHLPSEWLRASRRVVLGLGELWAVAEVTLNGRPAGVAWKEPFEVDLTAAARPGPNELLVRVANNWMNRLAGDARSPGGPRYTRTNVTGTGVPGLPWSKVEPRRSGLLGPVRLRAEEIR
jgi:hypothetical protein